jgi:ribosomal protein L20
MNDQVTLAARWHRLAGQTAWKVNAGWLLQQLTPLIIAAGAVSFAVIVWQRSSGAEMLLREMWPWLAGLAALVVLASYLLARRHFISQAEAMVRLESQLHLHNALSVAKLGRGVWPEIPSQREDGLKWHWPRVSAPFALCALCLIAAFYLPVSPDAAAVLPTVEPQAWQQMDDWLEKLEEEKIITPEEKEEQAAKIAALRDQEQEKWFSHESLNASDTLKEQLQREIGNMARDLADAERSLNALQNYASNLSEQAKEQMLKEYSEALEGMKNGSMKLDPKLLKELAQIDPKNLKSLSQNQLNQLRESLKQKSGSMAEMAPGKGFLGDGEGEDDMLAEGGPGEGEGEGPGKGGITRGPGTAPLTLSQEENRFGTNKNEAVVNEDMSKAQLGTLLNLQDGKHDVDKTYSGPKATGGTNHQGQGGQQVWRESLTPEEKAVLKRVFQ